EADKQDAVIDEMIQMLDQSDVVVSGADFKKDILDRESEGTTGLGMNIAIPHAKSGAVKRPAVVYGRNTGGVDWNSVDETDAKLIFMIAVPTEAAGDDHLRILQMLSRRLMDEGFRQQLLAADTVDEAYALLDDIK